MSYRLTIAKESSKDIHILSIWLALSCLDSRERMFHSTVVIPFQTTEKAGNKMQLVLLQDLLQGQKLLVYNIPGILRNLDDILYTDMF